MRVAPWRDGGEPGQRASQCSPYHRLQRAGLNPCIVGADGLLPISAGAYLRFSFKPIVKIVPTFSIAEFVKLEGTLPNSLLNLLDIFSQLPFCHALWVPLLHSGLPPSHERLVLTFACESVQNKLLGQTAGDVQTDVNPESSEHMLEHCDPNWGSTRWKWNMRLDSRLRQNNSAG